MNKPSARLEPNSVKVTPVTFLSGEHMLQGHLTAPATKPDTIAVLNAATGVPARFYNAFARWLAVEKNIACLTYDYRDFGASARGPMRQSSATMTDWAVHDQEAARRYAASSFPDIPLWVIGHSLGTLCLPFQQNLYSIDRVIAVASGLVHVRDHPWPYQALARLFWFGPFPLAASIFGYLPGKKLRVGSDLPKGVYWQWRRWCTRRDFFARDFGNELPFPDWMALKCAIKFVAIADDVMIPPATVWRLMQCYPAASKTQLALQPQDYELDEIGHIGVFSERCSVTWNDIVA